MLNDEARTVAERYSVAVHSHNLKVEPDRRTDADVLMAAGMTHSMLGAVLLRLKSEWDGSAKPAGDDVMDARLFMNGLKSWPAALARLTAWAGKRGHEGPAELAQKALVHWLDDACPKCRGRGYSKLPGSPVLGMACRSCVGTGKRHAPARSPLREALNLLDDCEARAYEVMKKRLRGAR